MGQTNNSCIKVDIVYIDVPYKCKLLHLEVIFQCFTSNISHCTKCTCIPFNNTDISRNKKVSEYNQEIPQSHGTVRKSQRTLTVTRHQEDNSSRINIL